MSKLHKAMFAFIIVFLSSLFWPALPSIQIVATCVLIAIVVALCLRFQVKTWVFGAMLGFIWASSVGHWYSSWQLPNRYFNENVIIEGNVESVHIQLNTSDLVGGFKNI